MPEDRASLPQWAQDLINDLEDKVYRQEKVIKKTFKEGEEKADLVVIWPETGQVIPVQDNTIFCLKSAGKNTIRVTFDKKSDGIHVRSSRSLKIAPISCNIVVLSPNTVG